LNSNELMLVFYRHVWRASCWCFTATPTKGYLEMVSL
jgi:hypothetical protein